MSVLLVYEAQTPNLVPGKVEKENHIRKFGKTGWVPPTFQNNISFSNAYHDCQIRFFVENGHSKTQIL